VGAPPIFPLRSEPLQSLLPGCCTHKDQSQATNALIYHWWRNDISRQTTLPSGRQLDYVLTASGNAFSLRNQNQKHFRRQRGYVFDSVTRACAGYHHSPARLLREPVQVNAEVWRQTFLVRADVGGAPDNDTLNYTWTANDGTVMERGPRSDGITG